MLLGVVAVAGGRELEGWEVVVARLSTFSGSLAHFEHEVDVRQVCEVEVGVVHV